MRLLVCGSRFWSTEAQSFRIHEELWALRPSLLMHGGAKGADECADVWASIPGSGAAVLVYRANWPVDGKAAGPIRNARMLRDGRPDRGLAFGPLWREVRDDEAPALGASRALFAALMGPGKMWMATGTGDMVRRMLDAGLPVRWVAAHDAPAVDLVEMPEPGEGSGGT